MKSLVAGLIFLFFTSAVLCQVNQDEMITPFNKEKYEKLKEYTPLDQGRVLTLLDTIYSNMQHPNAIRVVPVPEQSMERMPNMRIRGDVQYTMKINKYNLTYPYAKDIIPKKHTQPPDKRLYRPLNEKEE